jgi:hypothetical protein
MVSEGEMIMNKLLILLGCVFMALGGAAAQEKSSKTENQAIRVEKIAAATSVSALDPVGESSEFNSSVGTVYCWTKVRSQSVPATIKHVWYFEGKKVFEYSLSLKFNSTRTWSCKSVRPGDWKVDVTDDAGALLSSISFAVK